MIRWILISCLAFTACVPSASSDQIVLAELGKKHLLLEDVKNQIPKSGEMSPVDSALMVDRLIRTWAKNELLVAAAEFNLDEEMRSFEDLVKRYRNDLLKHAYIDQFVRENLDTSIAQDELLEYYTTNLDNFELKESIIQAQYTAVPLNAQKIDQAVRWFKKSRIEDKYYDWIEVFATKQSAYNDSSWIPLDEFLNEIPLETSNPYTYLNRTKRFTCEDTVMVYFVEVNELRIANSYSPLEYVEKRIRKMILNKRRITLIERIEENIISNAIEKGDLLIP
jgi:hypothetical protein|tara:strand:+ start:103 stop:942 length:840 start_codon:yes stop_codon:yes gene_type:complete